MLAVAVGAVVVNNCPFNQETILRTTMSSGWDVLAVAVKASVPSLL